MARRVLFALLVTLIAVAVVQLVAGVRELQARREYPPSGQLIDLGDVTIHAEVMGSGPDVVLLHGANGNLREFTFDLAHRLKDRYRVIMFDRPGLGWSGQPDGYGGLLQIEGESPQLQAEILRRAADRLGVTRPIVVGHSFGGAVAMAWAVADRDTGGVVMLGAVSHPWPGSLHWQYPLNASLPGGLLVVPLATAFVPHAYVDRVVSSIFEPQAAPEGYIQHVGTTLSLQRRALRANARQVNGLRPFVVEMAETYPELTLPIEVVHGDQDTIVPLQIHSRPLADRVESAHLTVLEGIGHMPHHADPEATIAAIDRAATRAGLR